MHYVYILFSENDRQFYTGCTNDLRARLELHNAGKLLQQKSVAHSSSSTTKPRWTKKMHFTERNISNRHMVNDIFGTAARAISQAEEASRARSDAEFCSKLDGLLQEADESELWLELLVEDCEVKSELARVLHKETDELISIFTTIVSKVRKNQK